VNVTIEKEELVASVEKRKKSKIDIHQFGLCWE